MNASNFILAAVLVVAAGAAAVVEHGKIAQVDFELELISNANNAAYKASSVIDAALKNHLGADSTNARRLTAWQRECFSAAVSSSHAGAAAVRNQR
jgi:hypothetical protein